MLTGCGSELVNFTSAELSQNSEEVNQNVTNTESEQANQADKKHLIAILHLHLRRSQVISIIMK